MALLSLAQDAPVSPSSSEEVSFGRWYPHDVALELAQTHNRLVMLYFHNEHCAFCQQMEMFVFSAPQVDKLLSGHFVVSAIDTLSPEGSDLVKRYRSRGTPTFIFLSYEASSDPGSTENGSTGSWKEVARLFGSQPRQAFAAELQDICDSHCL
ncbi:MAG: thioredoxin family protein [Deinococcales bacterium]